MIKWFVCRELMKNLTESNLELANKKAAQTDVEKEVTENKETRKEIYNRMVNSIKDPSIKISDKKWHVLKYWVKHWLL